MIWAVILFFWCMGGIVYESWCLKKGFWRRVHIPALVILCLLFLLAIVGIVISLNS